LRGDNNPRVVLARKSMRAELAGFTSRTRACTIAVASHAQRTQQHKGA
jgi:hypothetical protein